MTQQTLIPSFLIASPIPGDNPVYVQSVKEHGAAWRAGLRAGDRILRVDNEVVSHHSHQQVVQMIRGEILKSTFVIQFRILAAGGVILTELVIVASYY